MHPFIFQLSTISSFQFSSVIDVRSPQEFKIDHIQGAKNLPVLSDKEREIVGTLHKNESKFEAKRVGAEFVTKNVHKFLKGHLKSKSRDWQPLIYCWRGGQRSNSLALILAQIGWKVHILEGGYKSYRQKIVQKLHKNPITHRIVLLSGHTGTAKTSILHQIDKKGFQIIDLEGFANHRGSIFGSFSTSQPSQKAFEGLIATKLEKLDPKKVTFIEAESNKIGKLKIPPSLWLKMKQSSLVEIVAPLKHRSIYLLDKYKDLYKDPARLKQQIDLLATFQSKELIEYWKALIENQSFLLLAESIIKNHYDPRYKNSEGKFNRPKIHTVTTDSLKQKDVNRITNDIVKTII